jgi:2-C-methyl-D-erythritol 4-phosphate cytidylyltransferase/2-C-methyl-D-erythritol 2,4-cyclodiphosphate synthase
LSGGPGKTIFRAFFNVGISLKTVAIIPAGGAGKRLGGGIRKQYLTLSGVPVLVRALAVFQKSPIIDEIILAVPEEDLGFVRRQLVESHNLTKIVSIVAGGRERQDSVKNALSAIEDFCDIVVVSDGVRPFITEDMVEKATRAAAKYGAACIGVKVKDTLKEANERGVIRGTLPREGLWHAQTPQAFQYDLLRRAYAAAEKDGFYGTDDASLVERIGAEVMMIEGASLNVKITTPDDLILADAILGVQMRDKCRFRSGMGYDSHRFSPGRKLILGGIEIPHELGLAGHSDADALLHALCDALLGMAALGDIGKHFPDTDAAFKDISSLVLLKRVKAMIDAKGIGLSNIDVTVMMEKPKLAPYASKIASNIACALDIEESAVSVKAKTNEGMGFIGRGEGVAVLALVTGSERMSDV